jgi:hypothetical protein
MRRSPLLVLCALALGAPLVASGPAGAQSARRRPPASRPPAARPPASPTASAAPVTSETAPGPASTETAPASGAPAPSAPGGEAEPPAPTAGAGAAVDVDALRREYLALRDQLFRSRARAAAVASALYSTKLRIQLDYGSARFHTVTRAVVRLDGANVYDDAGGAIGSDRAPRWDGFVAPGRHLVTVRIEAVGKDDRRFAATLESTFAIQAPAGKDLAVRCAAKDDGDIAYQWQRSEQGSYRLRLDVAIESAARAAGAAGGKRGVARSPK